MGMGIGMRGVGRFGGLEIWRFEYVMGRAMHDGNGRFVLRSFSRSKCYFLWCTYMYFLCRNNRVYFWRSNECSSLTNSIQCSCRYFE